MTPHQDVSCRQLWRAVIKQAIADALDIRDISEATKAMRWLCEPSDDFSFVMECAGYDHPKQERMRRFMSSYLRLCARGVVLVKQKTGRDKMEIRALDGPLSKRDDSGRSILTRRGEYREAAIKILRNADYLCEDEVATHSEFTIRRTMNAMLGDSKDDTADIEEQTDVA